jgi:uncharacterized protein YkwD
VARRRARAAVLSAAFAVPAFAFARTPVSDAVTWAAWSSSPAALDQAPLADVEREALRRCGEGDARLEDTARQIAARESRGSPLPPLDAIVSIQRASGEPHPWPSVWSARAASPSSPATMDKLDAWLATADTTGAASWPSARRRCGAAVAPAGIGERVLVVVAVDALADLAPLPVRARAGQWLTVEARLRVPARGGAVFVVGPHGTPRSVPTAYDGRTLRARFAPDEPGAFAIQVVADLAGGSRPVLEATVFADVAPPDALLEDPAPGEEIAMAGRSDDDRLAAMAAAARAAGGGSPLVRDARLDAVARAHASRMAQTHVLSHDVGDGDPSERLRVAGFAGVEVGENVATAATVALAHRALWRSPSHRANLVRRDFDRLGVSAVRDDRGAVWIAEEFVSGE